jgi:hypothetical protein
MNKICLLLSLFLGTASCSAFAQENRTNEWGAVSNNLQMSIELKGGGSEITNGQSCILWIKYKNNSTNETLGLLKMNWVESDGTYSFIVVDPSGKDVSPNSNRPFGGSATIMDIGPGQVKELEYNLSGVCKINKIGIYKIIAKRIILPGSGKKLFQVVSNPLYLIVIPGKGEPTNAPPH